MLLLTSEEVTQTFPEARKKKDLITRRISKHRKEIQFCSGDRKVVVVVEKLI